MKENTSVKSKEKNKTENKLVKMCRTFLKANFRTL